MKMWHWGTIVLVVIVYIVGAQYPGAWTAIKGKIGA